MTFEQAFYEINGRAPTPEETKHAYAVKRIVKEADLDPILLMFLADAQAQAARERGVADIRRMSKEAVDRLKDALPSISDARQSISALEGVQTALHALTRFMRDSLAFATLVGTLVGVVWALSLVAAWKYAYEWGRRDAGEATHRIVCTDLSQYIAGMSGYWRKLGYPEAAEKLGSSYDRTCR